MPAHVMHWLGTLVAPLQFPERYDWPGVHSSTARHLAQSLAASKAPVEPVHIPCGMNVPGGHTQGVHCVLWVLLQADTILVLSGHTRHVTHGLSSHGEYTLLGGSYSVPGMHALLWVHDVCPSVDANVPLPQSLHG
jgi:hypothetical protein